MNALPAPLRGLLEDAAQDARDMAEAGALAALNALAVPNALAFPHLNEADKKLRVALRAQARQLGDVVPKDAVAPGIAHLVEKVAYDTWHRLLFTRFLAENQLLHHPGGARLTLQDCEELIREDLMLPQREFIAPDGRTLAVEFAARMLPAIFRADDPAGKVGLPPEHRSALFKLIDDLPRDVFVADDGLGWCYQFWQARRKEAINRSGRKIGANELPAVTQLFTEDYMVLFLLHNTIGAWWTAKRKSDGRTQKAEGIELEYLRVLEDGSPAAGGFPGWPKTLREFRLLDPCCGSGHFLVAAFILLVWLRMQDEGLSARDACDAVLRDNLHGLELDPRCTQIAAFNLALAAWKFPGAGGYRPLPTLHIACSGLGVNARKEDWLALANGNDRLRQGMERLHDLFQKAPDLGSLIDPRAVGHGDLVMAGFAELEPLLGKALVSEKAQTNDELSEMGVAAQGMARAAEILARHFHLVVTNVPYLVFKKQGEILKTFCENSAPDAKMDLATVFVRRCMELATPGGTAALVTPQNWLFLGSYQRLRERLLESTTWEWVVRLGPGAFETIGGEVVNVALVALSRKKAEQKHELWGLDASAGNSANAKADALRNGLVKSVSQTSQLKNPDARIAFDEVNQETLLANCAISMRGIVSGDRDLWMRDFWEIPKVFSRWKFLQSTVESSCSYGGRHQVIDWATEGQGMLRPGTENMAYGKRGIVISLMTELAWTIYDGQLYDNNCGTVVPNDPEHLAAIVAFCASADYRQAVRRLDQKLNVTNATLVKVPFDLAHWQSLAAEKYPHGLPKPHSDDPTQWLFDGHPKGAENPLQVAAARLLGYQWPRQTGSSFPDCPALGPDGLEAFADADGIVCIPPAGQEQPAEQRLRALLAAAFGTAWSATKEGELLAQAGYAGKGMEAWLRNGFAEQHGKRFHQRPFVWHFWDGRKDGFSALVNYHKLDRALLDKLIYTYLGDWITRQEAGGHNGEGGSDGRLTAARDLQRRLKLIAEGEPPYDIFVRWKPLAQQPIGWEPDLNDGVRLNIRPFVAAGVLRKDPNVNWKKDRGTDPVSAPWFGVFKGERINDHHLTLAEKRAARAAQNQAS